MTTTAMMKIFYSKPSYPFTLIFTREFTEGALVGLTHDDSIGFCSKFDAEEWVS